MTGATNGTHAQESDGHGATSARSSATGDSSSSSGSAHERAVRADVGAVKGGVAHQLREETEAARALLASLADLTDNAPDIAASAIEGETELVAVIAKALDRLLIVDVMLNTIAARVDAMKTRADRLVAQRDNIRGLISVAMDVARLKTRETSFATISVRAVPPKVEVINEAEIPLRFWKPQDPKLDKKALLDALKSKERIPGATLSNGGTTISIKVD